VLNDPYASVVPYSVWPVAGALTDHVIVAPVGVMAEAPTPLMTSGVPAGAVGAGVGVGVGVAARVGVGVGAEVGAGADVGTGVCRALRWELHAAKGPLDVVAGWLAHLDAALVAMYGTIRATMPTIMMPVETQSRVRRRRGAGDVAGSRSSIQRVPSQNM
jgi:hypothetical protein